MHINKYKLHYYVEKCRCVNCTCLYAMSVVAATTTTVIDAYTLSCYKCDTVQDDWCSFDPDTYHSYEAMLLDGCHCCMVSYDSLQGTVATVTVLI